MPESLRNPGEEAAERFFKLTRISETYKEAILGALRSPEALRELETFLGSPAPSLKDLPAPIKEALAEQRARILRTLGQDVLRRQGAASETFETLVEGTYNKRFPNRRQHPNRYGRSIPYRGRNPDAAPL